MVTIRVPEKKYIQTLILGRMNAALVVDDLQLRKIPIVSGMKSIYNELTTTNPDFFKKDNNTDPDPAWLKSLGVEAMYAYRFKKVTETPILGCAGAMKILEDPKLVRWIHVLSIAGISRTDIELILNAKYNISFESPDFDTFIDCFANYDGWSYADKEMYINQDVQDQELKALFKKALSGERSMLIWELGLGTDPSASFSEMLQDMFTDSYFNFKKKIKFDPDTAQKFAQLAIKIADRMERDQDKEREEADLFSEMKFKLDNENTTDKKKQAVVDIGDMDVIMPDRTETKIVNLDALMNGEPSNVGTA